MKNNLIVFCLWTFPIFLSAQYTEGWQKVSGTSLGFAVDSTYYTLVSDANVREKGNTQAAVLTKLPIGTPVKVAAISDDSFTVRGVRMPWLQVSFMENGKKRTGFVWGGFMATAAIQTPDEEGYENRGVLYLAGIAAYTEKNNQLTAQIRAALKGKELGKLEFTTAGDLSYYPSMEVRFDQFENVKAVISLDFRYDACGYPSGNNLLFWQKNNQFSKVLEVNSVSDAGVFYSSEDYILPYDKGGISDHIVVIADSAQMKESGDNFKKESQEMKITLYRWAAGKLTKVKELASKL
jgi:hypothetical protein